MRFTFIDALRAIAALSVVLFHALEGEHIPLLYQSMPASLQAVFFHANLGVAIFFVLSGFVIAHSLSGIEPTPGNLGCFMLKRSLRLDPPYWATIALACAIVVVKGGAMFTAPQIVEHLIYAQDLIGIQPISPIFWTLCLELQFYLVFALILLTRSRLMLLAAFVVSLPLSTIVIWHGLFTSLWYGFLLGVGAYLAWREQIEGKWFLAYAGLLVALSLARDDWFMMVCVATALLVYLFALQGRIGTAMNWRWIQFLGLISYSLYLIHNPVTGLTFRIGYRLTGETPFTEMIWFVVSIVASVAGAALLWWLVERPSIALSKAVSKGYGHGLLGEPKILNDVP